MPVDQKLHDETTKALKVFANKSFRWARASSWGQGPVPLGWEVKNEPGQLAICAKRLLAENIRLQAIVDEYESKNANTG